MGPSWGQQDPSGPHVGPMNFAVCVYFGNVVSRVPHEETQEYMNMICSHLINTAGYHLAI